MTDGLSTGKSPMTRPMTGKILLLLIFYFFFLRDWIQTANRRDHDFVVI
jgi:hypothetical protein